MKKTETKNNKKTVSTAKKNQKSKITTKTSKMVEKTKISYKDLTINQIESELKRETYKSKYKTVLSTTIYALIIVFSLAALIATLIMPVLQISGSSMKPTLNEGEIVLSLKTKKLSTGDIVAFYHGNKILIKRVIAKSGDWINITEDGDVYVNDVLLKEPYIIKKHQGNIDIEFPYQVPEESYFVLGDERKNSIDSRNTSVGTVSKEDIIGKVIFRVWPIKKIGITD